MSTNAVFDNYMNNPGNLCCTVTNVKNNILNKLLVTYFIFWMYMDSLYLYK